jgi:transcriptional regulator with XRE-family HTH domain
MNYILKKAMAEKGISQNRLSQIARIPQGSLSAIVNDKLYPCPAWRRRISDTLGVPEDVLFPIISKTDSQEGGDLNDTNEND